MASNTKVLIKRLTEELERRFPLAFPKDPKLIKPLKIGIKADLIRELQDSYDVKLIGYRIYLYTRKPVYLQKILSEQERIDLEGNPCGEVTDKERFHAGVILKEKRLENEIKDQIESHRIKISQLLKDLYTKDIHSSETNSSLKKEYINLLLTECEKLNRRAETAFRHFFHGKVRQIRRIILQAYEKIIVVDKSNRIKQYHRRAKYLYFTSEGIYRLTNAEFESSKQWYKRALDVAQGTEFNDPLRLPNKIVDIKDISLHELYIESVESFKDGDFYTACGKFNKWLTLNPERKGKYNKKYDNYSIFRSICRILAYLKDGKMVKESIWEDIDYFVEHANVANNTWALLRKVSFIRAMLYSDIHISNITVTTGLNINILNEQLIKIAQSWHLLVFENQLYSEDRTEAFKRQSSSYPIFFNIFDEIISDNNKWQDILLQNLRNIFLLKADYESRRAVVKKLPKYIDPNPLLIPCATLEEMTILDLSKLISNYLCKRSTQDYFSAQDFFSFKKLLEEILPRFNIAIQKNNFNMAVTTQKKILTAMQGLIPHVICIDKTEPLAQNEQFSENLQDKDSEYIWAPTIKATCRRLWRSEPKKLELYSRQAIQKGDYYYLRSKWYGIRRTECKSKNKLHLKSSLPKWINFYYENLVGTGKFKFNKERFTNWILQISASKRLLACQLASAIKFYNVDDFRNLWLYIYRHKLPPEAKTKEVAYLALGHSAKSGSANTYLLGQALHKVSPNERSFDSKEAFLSIDYYNRADEKPRTVVFIDDFIGKGTQAVEILKLYFERYKWLSHSEVYYCTLFGFKDGIKHIKTKLQDRIKDVHVSRMLNESDKAFSIGNPLWETEDDRVRAEQWASDIGIQCLPDSEQYKDRDLHKLGWEDSQALITFHYNTPNNTLPLFWGTGRVNGKKWIPLIERSE